MDFSVTWVSQASVSIVKKDKKTNAAVAGAVYGLYSDPDCTNLIMEMPATDANGASSVTLNKTGYDLPEGDFRTDRISSGYSGA